MKKPQNKVILVGGGTRSGKSALALSLAGRLGTRRLYLASARFDPQPETTPGAPRPRPKIIPGSMKILVYGMHLPIDR